MTESATLKTLQLAERALVACYGEPTTPALPLQSVLGRDAILEVRRAIAIEMESFWTSSEAAAAEGRGWNLFDAEGSYDIQKVDDIGVFETDRAAIKHVRKMADRGDYLSNKALRLNGREVPETA